MGYTWFMARRMYGRSGGDKGASRTATSIATAGVALGVAIMVVAIGVVLGFKAEVQRKVVGMGGHMAVLNYESLYRSDSQPIVISDSLLLQISQISGVAHAQRFCVKTGMLKTDESFQGVAFRGVDEGYDLSFLREHLVEGEIGEPFSGTNGSGRIVVSQMLARQLHLSVGDHVYAYFFDQRLRARRFTVVALYATHMAEYDRKLVFCDYKTVHQLLGFEPDQASGAEVNLTDIDLLESASEQVSGLVNHRQDAYGAYYTSPTIKESYPHIFAWLDLLDLNVLVILALMVAVAGFTTVCGLLIIILERTQFIGTMKALGADNATLRRLFILYALHIVGRGMLLGNALGLGLCLLQQHFGWVHLDAATYYVSVVPVQISWPLILMVNVLTFAVSTLALVLPSFVVAHIMPAKSIRFE